MSWLWFIPILLVMVVIHELGHFLTARLFKMKVLEFGIGFPPKVWSRKTKDGMEWSVNALPIGGFVRIDGENGDSDDPNSFGKKPTWQRAIVLCAGPFMNLVLAFVIYLLLSTGGKDVPAGPVTIMRVEANSPAAAAGLQVGDAILKANSTEVTTTRDVSIETTLNKTQPLDLTVQRGSKVFQVSVQPRKNPPDGEGAIGVMMGYTVNTLKQAEDNTALGLKTGDTIVAVDGKPVANNVQLLEYFRTVDKPSVDVTVQRTVNGQTVNETKTLPAKVYVGYVYKNSDAATKGLPVGAQILALNDQKINTAVEYQNYLTSHQGQPVTISYLDPKDKTQKSISITSNYSASNSVDNRSPRVDTAIDGLAVNISVHQNLSPVQWFGEAWNQTIYAITLIPRSIEALINGSVGFESFAGPVGMAQITNTVIDNGGLLATLSLMALLSVNLGIINILPLPALDGGRLVFVLIEMVFRRRVPPEKEGLVHFAGMIALLSLMVVFTWQDIARLITGAGFQ